MSEEIKIEKGVPMPTARATVSKYPWRSMDVGDSFFAANKTSTQMGGNVTTWTRLSGFKFACRAVEGGVRVWRIK